MADEKFIKTTSGLIEDLENELSEVRRCLDDNELQELEDDYSDVLRDDYEVIYKRIQMILGL